MELTYFAVLLGVVLILYLTGWLGVDLTVTVANVARVSGTTVKGTAGATITAGQLLYADPAALDSANQPKLKPADADLSADAARLAGIALHGSLNNQPITYQTDGVVNPGATVVVGEIYVASGTAGGIAPKADLASADWVSILGIGTSASQITLGINNSEVQVP
jgi:hypothetical protein